jgi:hypothetical protein
MSKTTKGSCEKTHQHDQMVNERGGRFKNALLFIPKCVKSTLFDLWHLDHQLDGHSRFNKDIMLIIILFSDNSHCPF